MTDDLCINTFTIPTQRTVFECAHPKASHDEDGICLSCSCCRYVDEVDPPDSYLLRDSESMGGGGARDSSASYRSEMRDAGRGDLLR